jgi:hypothetical protein
MPEILKAGLNDDGQVARAFFEAAKTVTGIMPARVTTDGYDSYPRAREHARGTPHGAAPPTPPGIRVTYHGGSSRLSRRRNIESGETDRIEVVVSQGRLDRRVS